jgi:signal transduction histidine kinase
MKALVQAAREAPEPRLDGEDLAIVDSEIDRLERTTQGLLDFARPPALDKGLFPLARLIRHAVSLVASTASIHGVTVRCGDLDKGLEVEADYQQLFQVVLNLLLNALDATPRGGEVEIRMDRADGRVKVTVADTGEGLPAQLGAKIFEPFVSTKPTGTGLGLSTCRRIVQAHAGEIDAASRSLGGALVWFSLPLGAPSPLGSS